jgi:excinuclease ABC subunit B
LAVVDDPTAKQRTVQGKAGAYAGARKYGDAANLPTSAMKKRFSSPSPELGGSPARGRGGRPSQTGGASVLSPLVGEGRGGGSTTSRSSKVHKPHLDEMHGPESLPYRPGRGAARKPSRDDKGASGGSKIFQPTDSRQSGQEFGPAPRSTGGAPGHRGGWKKR